MKSKPVHMSATSRMVIIPLSQLERLNATRGKMPRPTQAMRNRGKYNRKDKSWQEGH